MTIRRKLITFNLPSVTTSSASGIFNLSDVGDFRTLNTWPRGPVAPTGLSAGVGGSQLVLSWTAPATTYGTITNYLVEFTPAGGATSTVLTGSTSTSYTLIGLTNGVTYTVRVAAVTFTAGDWSSLTTGTPNAFSAMAVMLTSGTSYTIPAGAFTMKAWVVGAGGGSTNYSGGAGGCAYKTWTGAAGTVSYSVASAVAQYQPNTNGGDTTCTYDGVTITGAGGKSQANGRDGGTFSGGDGGANGGAGTGSMDVVGYGGAVGGNGTQVSCGRFTMTDVSGLKAALALAGISTTEGCACAAVFGSGGYANKYGASPNCNNQGWLAPGIGGGAANWYSRGSPSGGGAVVLYFE
jgi:hypothetical protein